LHKNRYIETGYDTIDWLAQGYLEVQHNAASVSVAADLHSPSLVDTLQVAGNILCRVRRFTMTVADRCRPQYVR